MTDILENKQSAENASGLTFNKNQQTGVPIEHYRQIFAEADPKLLSKESGVPFDGEKFSLKLIGRPVSICWPEMKVVFEDDGCEAADYTKILVSRLVLSGHLVPSLGEMKSYAQMPWGEVYLRQFSGRCISRLAFSYGKNVSGFKEICTKLGAHIVDFGDASFDFDFIEAGDNKLVVRTTIWEADDEFPPAAQILFSDNFPQAFTAEDIAVVGDILINSLKGKW